MVNESFDPGVARLVLERGTPNETIADLADLSALLDGLVVPCAWLAMVVPQPDSQHEDDRIRFLQAVRSRADDDKAAARFYPWFRPELYSSIPQVTLAPRGPYEEDAARSVDPSDPIDIGVQVGLNAWIRATIRRDLPNAYHRVFSFALVDRIHHESPLVVETVIATSGLAGAALYRIAASVYKLRATRAETRTKEAAAAVEQASVDIRVEGERQKLRQDAARAKQEEAKAEIYIGVARLLKERRVNLPPEELARMMTEATAPAVNGIAELELSRFELRSEPERPAKPSEP